MTNLDPNVLDGFTGDLERWRHPLWRKIIYTPGVRYLTLHGLAWLLDAIASYQRDRLLKMPKMQEMQFWTLDVDLEKHTSVLTCDDGDGKIVIRQEISFTDCNLPQVKIWLEQNEEGGLTAMLPSER